MMSFQKFWKPSLKDAEKIRLPEKMFKIVFAGDSVIVKLRFFY